MSIESKKRQLPEGASSAELAAFLRAVCDGQLVSRESAIQLLRCDHEGLPELLATACYLKEQYRPGIITYSRKVFIPLTNLCRDYCGYCTYRRDPGQPGAHTMSPEQVLEVVKQGERDRKSVV